MSGTARSGDRSAKIDHGQPEASGNPGGGALRGQAADGPSLQAAGARPLSVASATANAGEDRLRSAALALLQLQSDMRKARNQAELAYFIANEPRQLLRAQQIVVLERGIRKDLVVRAVSSLTTVDRASPLVLWFENVIRSLGQEFGLGEAREFDAAAFPSEFEIVQSAYPLRNLLWVPWATADGEVIGGTLLARSTPWTSQEMKIATHLAGAFAHAWDALHRPSARSFLGQYTSRRSLAIAAVVTLALLVVPVPMTALAPVEVAPRNPFVVTSGVEGVVKSVAVEPSETVKSGQVLVMLADTVLKNRFEIAEREVLVAETKYKKAGQLAFVDSRGRHELAVAMAELELKRAERDYARELLARSEIKAEGDGVAFFADKKDLVGRPVAIGEKLMEIANPKSTEFHIDLPVSDAIVLRTGARVKVFLDSDPLNPIEARVVRAAYKATLRETQQLAFRLVAEAGLSRPIPLRLGARGTAQVYSDMVPLGFYLFRRPIAAARQWLGL